MNRRTFLATAAATSASLAFADEDKPVTAANQIPIVDTHQHLWDITKFKLAWIDPESPEVKILGHNFTPKEYAAATKGLNVVKAVYMEVDVIPEQQQKEADYIIELCESGKTPTCAAVVSGRPQTPRFCQVRQTVQGEQVREGHPPGAACEGVTPEYFLDPKFVKGMQILGELGLSFDLCVRPEELPDHIKLVEKCPDTRFILDHCGNGKPHAQAGRTRAVEKRTWPRWARRRTWSAR